MLERRYSELIKLETFEERFEYLKIGGLVGAKTFGVDRYLNQLFYRSSLWRSVRNSVIVRDMGFDLGVEGYEIVGSIYVHHMNPLAVEDICEDNVQLIDPEFLICTALQTHNAVHYGDARLLTPSMAQRRPNDTCPWKG